jgi:hypothetical protein
MRSYGANDIIALPTLSAAAAVALGKGLLTAAKAQTPLPTSIVMRMAALKSVHGALHQALSQKPQPTPDLQRARSADLAEDQAWSTLHDWLAGWSKLRSSGADNTRAIYAILFPTRLKFTQLPFKLEWAESDSRLARIARDGFDVELEKLGGKPILDQLRQAHRAYGDALGITAEGQDPITSTVRDLLQTFTTTLRAYFQAVTAHADPADPASVALTDSLLAPLHRWQSHISEPVATATFTSPTPTSATRAAATPAETNVQPAVEPAH